MAKKKYIERGNKPMSTKTEETNPTTIEKQVDIAGVENIDVNPNAIEELGARSEAASVVDEALDAEDNQSASTGDNESEDDNIADEANVNAVNADENIDVVDAVVNAGALSDTPDDIGGEEGQPLEDKESEEDKSDKDEESDKDEKAGEGKKEEKLSDLIEEEEVIEFTKKNIIDLIVYGEDELTIVRTLLKSAKAKFKESNIVVRLLDAIESYLVAPASASKGGSLVQTYAIELNKAEKGDLTNLAIFMLSKLTGKESEERGLKSLSLISIVNTTRLVEDVAVKQESLKLIDALAELHSAEERKKKVDVLISLNKAFNVNPRYLNSNAVEILREYFSK